MSDYDSFAEQFDAHAVSSAYNAHYDRPAVLGLLGPVAGLRVLDAGCGSGLVTQELLALGAAVAGLDVSLRMVELAAERLGPAVDLRVHDLNDPLDWLASESFDRVVMALVLHHLENPVPALRELHRVLVPGGRLVVSTVHPTADWLRLGGSYFTDQIVEELWNIGFLVHFRRAPLEAITADFADAGFLIERIVEPRPAPTMAAAFPETAAKLETEPRFITFSLVKP